MTDITNEFIFFGCWNRIDCEKEYIARDIVLDYIKNNEKSVDELYLAGDNWYPNLIKQNDQQQYKYYLLPVLISGYLKIFSLKKTTYIALGNHDIDNDEEGEGIKQNCMINTQKYYVKKIQEKSFFDNLYEHLLKIKPNLEDLKKYFDKEPNLEDLLDFDQKKLERLLSSLSLNNKSNSKKNQHIMLKKAKSLNNIYIKKLQTKMMLYENIGLIQNKGYSMIVLNTNNINDRYLTRVVKTIGYVKKYKLPIFVMGHHPLFYYKRNKENKKDYISKWNNRNVDRFFDILADNGCIYLCADTHNFSIMKIKKDEKHIIQVTSGTGGADPDIINETDVKGHIYENYSIDYSSKNAYGYTKIYINNHDITVEYKKIVNASNESNTLNSYLSIFKYKINYDTNNIQPNIIDYISKDLSKISICEKDRNTLSENIVNNIDNYTITGKGEPQGTLQYCFKKPKKEKEETVSGKGRGRKSKK